MTEDKYELSRRKVLGGVGAIGLASAGAGLGTTAFFSDQETFTNNALMAGSLDMKAAYSAHYSDWSEDEDDGVNDIVMYDGPPGTTGDAGDLPGSGYTGMPANDAWLIAVTDPDQFLANTEQASDGSATCPNGTDADDLEQPVIDLGDVKPGDFGEVTFDLALCDNPGYVWLDVDTARAHENGYTEPERGDPDESGPVVGPEGEIDPRVELLDVVQAAYWIDDGNNYQNGNETPASVGSLRDIINELAGLGGALEGDIPASQGGGTGEQGCFSAGQHSVVFAWWVPVDHGNEIQTDSVSFELGFYTEQCRHNDGSRDPLRSFLGADAELKETPWDGSITDATGQSEVVVDVGALTSVDVDIPGFSQLPVAYAPQAVRVSTGTTVRWTWLTFSDPPVFNQIPHNVHAVDGSFHSGPPIPPTAASDFTHTFNSPGIYPYSCDPHGAPHLVPSFEGGEVLNEFGMRGAIIVE